MAAGNKGIDAAHMPCPAVNRHGHMVPGKLVGIDLIHLDTSAQSTKAYSKRTFRHTVAGQKGLAVKTSRLQSLGKKLQGFLADHFRANPGNPPGMQIVVGNFIVAQATGGQIIAKRRAKGDGALVFRHKLQPHPGPHGKVAGAEIVY